MARTSLALRLQSLREKARWTQAELARRSGISAAFLSQLEKGSRNPSAPCLQRIADALGIPIEALLEEVRYRARKRGPQRLHKHRRALRQIFARCRPVQIACKLQQAFKTAGQTRLGLALLAELERQNRPPAFWSALKHLAEILNAAEQLFVLHLLVAGADLEDLTPADVGFERSVVWNPLRRWLALVLKVDGGYLVLFPQLGVITKPGRFRTLDVLIAAGGMSAATYIDGEIDGPGHALQARQDAERDEEVRLLVMRIPVAEVERADFVERFVKSVLARCRLTQRAAA